MKEGSALSVTMLCVGKLRERFYADAAQEYLKRLSRLMPTEVVELPDEKEPTNPSPALNEAVMRKEGEAILRHIPPKAYVITLCIEGRQLSSEAVAAKLKELFTQGKSDIVFIIGGSLGLHPSVTARADLKLPDGNGTLGDYILDRSKPMEEVIADHMLLEQLFRAAKINAGERYHK